MCTDRTEESTIPQSTEPADATRPETPQRWLRGRRRFVVALVAGLVPAYLVVAYLLIPLSWEMHFARHPSLGEIPGVTHTRIGIPADPLNVALIGSEAEVREILSAAGWDAARPLGLRSDLGIAEATVLNRPDDAAPVSHLYLFGRAEDLVFEQPVGSNPRSRHHVRLWRCPAIDRDGRPLWVGAASFDQSVGFSHTTGEITHHIAADVDAERDHLIQTLLQTGRLSSTYVEAGFHHKLQGRNGGGDPWHTDGNLSVGVIEPLR